MLVQLRMGNIPLQKYLNKIRKRGSLKCQACQTQDETVHHYLLNCPVYRVQRGHLEREIRHVAQSANTLLANPKVFPHLFRYINATRCFQEKLCEAT